MILIGVGANLTAPGSDSLVATCDAAISALETVGIVVLKRSRWYRSAPVPPSEQPWFVNGVIQVRTSFGDPGELLALLHGIEDAFGRRRGRRNAARTLDLDLLDCEGRISRPGEAVVLPHPRMHERAFVLLPLAEVAPSWRHPVSGIDVEELIRSLPDGQVADPISP